jgi:hypothetical protein
MREQPDPYLRLPQFSERCALALNLVEQLRDAI